MKCSAFRRNLSAFLDHELNDREEQQMKEHLSQCEACRRETEQMRMMVSIVADTPRPQLPPRLWEETRQRLETVTPQRAFPAISRWSFIPVAAAILILVLYLAGSHFALLGSGSEAPSIALYLQEHTLSQSEDVLAPNPVSELTLARMEQPVGGTEASESVPDLELLMEVHYGTNPTDGS